MENQPMRYDPRTDKHRDLDELAEQARAWLMDKSEVDDLYDKLHGTSPKEKE